LTQDGDEGAEEEPVGEVVGVVDDDRDVFGVETMGAPVVEAAWQGIPGPAEVVRDLAALNGVKTCDGSRSLRPSRRMMLLRADCSRCGSTSTLIVRSDEPRVRGRTVTVGKACVHGFPATSELGSDNS
jgi:hypothetical protein